MVDVMSLNHNPSIWNDPQRFIPERFENPNRYGFHGFGLGPRKCLGMHFVLPVAKLLLARLIQQFHWKVPQAENYQKSQEIPLSKYPFIFVPNVKVTFEPKLLK